MSPLLITGTIKTLLCTRTNLMQNDVTDFLIDRYYDMFKNDLMS
ncbi:MAG TPA: hypothetical protein PKJ08_13340 [Candidatus Cloacimonadota bacterium]|nr:hypothetical protein [Candidatus Cloacimonadota bacterium]